MSGNQLREGQGNSGAPDKNTEVSTADLEALRVEVMTEIDTEGKNLALIGRHGQRARRLVPLVVAFIALNVIMAFLLPYYGISWIVASFFVYMYYFIVLLFPTTRRVRTPADKKDGLKGKKKMKKPKGVKGVILRGKKAVVVAFWNSFFIGTQTLARGVVLILSISIAFALLSRLVVGTLDLFSTTIVTIQAAAIIGYYWVIIHYRPYSKDFQKTVARVRRNKSKEVRWVAYLKGVFIVLALFTVLVIFIMSAIFLPGRSIDAVLSHVNDEITLALFSLVVIFVSQFIIIRYIQGFDSARITTQFIKDKLEFLRRDILPVLDAIEGEEPSGERSAKFRAVQKKFRVSRIYKVVYKDLFGFLPTYPIIVDFRSVFEKDVADALGEEIPLDIPSGKAA